MVPSVSPSSSSVDVLTIQGTYDLTYEKVNEVIGTATDVYVDGYVSIGEDAFKGSSIRTIRIGKSVIGIKDQAFKGVNSLTNIIFDEGSNLKTIGYQSFYNTSLVDVTLPVSTNVLFDEAFACCKKLLSVLLTGDNLTYIGHNAFEESTIISLTTNKNQLDTLNLSVGLITLGGKQNVNVRTFDSPAIESLLTSKLINSSTHTISGSGELTREIVNANIGNGSNGSSAADVIITGFSSIGHRAFFDSYQLSGSITIPTSVTSIGTHAFDGCRSLTTVIFLSGSQLTTIGQSAFSYSGLEGGITIPSSVTSIGEYAFHNSFVSSVSFESGSQLTYIGGNVFYNSRLASITLPPSLQTIGIDTFNSCSNLTSLSFPEGLTTIEYGAFAQTALSGILIFPKSLTTIGNGAFHLCSHLTTVVFNVGSQMSSMGTYSFSLSGLVSFTAPQSVLDNLGLTVGTGLTVSGKSGVSVYALGDIIITGSGVLYNQEVDIQLSNYPGHYGIGNDGSNAVNIKIVGFTSTNWRAFYQMKISGSITIPSSMTNIGEDSFRECINLTSVIFESASNLVTIGKSAFLNSGLSGTITFPSSLNTIERYAFGNQNITSILFESGSNLVTIGDSAFISCGLLGTIVIPASVETIEGWAFYDCSSLISIKIESGSMLSTLGQYSFYGSDLQYFTAPLSVLTSLGLSAGTGKTVGNKTNVTVTVYVDTIEGSGVLTQAIVFSAINDGSYAEDVVISGFSSIADDAFQLSKNISGSITIPASVTVIGENSFNECINLTSVIFESGSQLVTIGRNSFIYCYSVTSVNFNVLNKLTTIGDNAFRQTGLSGTITIPASVTSIEYDAFSDCSSLTGVVFESGIQLQTIGSNAFSSSGLSGTITIPASVTSIGSYAFSDCSSLTGVVFESGIQLQTIGSNAFRSSGLSGTITIPASVTSIGSYAFYQCSSLTSVTFEYNSQIDTIANDAFEGSGLAYFTAPITFLSSINLTIGTNRTVGGKVGVTVIEALPPNTIKGEGVLTAEIATANIGHGYGTVDVIVIGFTSIASYAFMQSGMSGSITLPASLTSIGEYAFSECTLLSSVIFESGSQLETIGNNAFNNSGLSGSISLPASLITISNRAFYYTSLSSVIFESGSKLVTIGDRAFKGTGLSGQMTLPASVTSIGYEAFYQLTASSFSFESGSQLETIGYGAFYETGLSGSIYLPASLTSIGEQAFYGCTSMTSVSFPIGSQLTTLIGDKDTIFEDSGLTTFTAPQSVLTLFNVEAGTGKTVGGKSPVTVIEAVPPIITISGEGVLTKAKVEEAIQDGSNAVDVIVTGFTSIDTYAFQDSLLSGSITLPASLTSIGGTGAFIGCTSLTTVIFESGSQLETIGYGAFQLTGLTSITLPASLITISEYAFYNSSSLTTVSFDSGSKLVTIGDVAFKGTGLSGHMTIPASVTSIGDSAFFQLTASSFSFESGSQLTTIAQGAFYETGLSGSISLPSSLTSIGQQAFYGCTSMTSLSFPIGSQLTTVSVTGPGVFAGSALSSLTGPKQVLDAFGVDAGSGKTVGGKEYVTVTLLQTIISGDGVLTQEKVQEAIQDGSNAVDVIITGFVSIAVDAFKYSNNISGSITIPNSVTSIGNSAFYECSSLTSVIFESGSKLSTIGSDAFYKSGLTSITLPSTVTSIGERAFYQCTSMSSVSYESGSNLKTIGDSAFYNSGLSGSIAIPASVESIGDTSFFSCSGLNSISFETGSQVVSIGYGAFSFSGLSGSIAFPASLTTIDASFTNCPSLTSVSFPLGSQLNSVGAGEFEGTGLSSLTGPKQVLDAFGVVAGSGRTVGGKENVTVTLLQTIIAGQGILTKDKVIGAIQDGSTTVDLIITGFTSIADNAFEESKNISGSVTLPASLTSIGDYAFRSCSSLTSVIFESDSQLETIGGNAFQGSGLSGSITFPASLTSIGNSAFSDSSLTTVSFPYDSQLTTIGNSAFSSLGLTGSIYLPGSLKSIGDGSFFNCSSLTYVSFGNLESVSQLETIGVSAFRDSGLSSIYFPASLTSIGERAFDGCSGLTSANFDGVINLTTIESSAFKQTGLTSVTVPASVQSIGNDAFAQCADLSSVLFESGSQLTSIGSSAFHSAGENSLSSWSIAFPASLASIGDSAFSNSSKLSEVSFPPGSLLSSLADDAFTSSEMIRFTAPQSVLTHIDVEPGNGKTVGGKENVMVILLRTTISGTGELTPAIVQSEIGNGSLAIDVLITGFSRIGVNAFKDSQMSGSVTIADTILSIGNYAFNACSSLTSIIFEDESTVETIGEKSFMLSGLSGSITLPSSLSSIGEGAFEGCSSLTTAIFESGSILSSIGDSAFDGSGLTSITLPSSLASLGSYSFHQCASLTTVNFESGINLLTLESNTFSQSGLTSMTLPASLRYIRNQTFKECENLSLLSYESGTLLETIDNEAFMSTGLSGSITLPATLLSIGVTAFSGCADFTSVNFPLGSILSSLGVNSFAGSGLSSFTAPQSVLSAINLTVGPNKTVGGKTGVEVSLPRFAIYGSGNLTRLDVIVAIGNGSGYANIIISGYITIESNAFSNSYLSGSITISSSITTIGDYAFGECSSLTSVIFESGSQLTTIGAAAFLFSGLNGSVTLPSSLTSIGDSAFSYSSLTSVSFQSESLLSIGDEAFASCSSLTSVSFLSGSQLSSIGNYTFSYTSITGHITLPSSLTSIGDGAFQGSSSSFSVSFEIDSKLTSVGDNVFSGSGLTSFTATLTVLLVFGASADTGSVGGLDGIDVSIVEPPPSTCVTSPVTISIESANTGGTKYITSDTTGSGNGGEYGCIDAPRGSTLIIYVVGSQTHLGQYPVSITNYTPDGSAGASLTGVVKTITDGGAYNLTWTLPDTTIEKYQYQCLNAPYMRGIINVTDPAPEQLRGDMTEDGTITVYDVMWLQKHVNNEGGYLEAGDMNEDGRVDVADVIWLHNHVNNVDGYANLEKDKAESIHMLVNSSSSIGGDAFMDSGLSTFAAPQNVLNRLGLEVGTGKTVRGKGGVTVTLYGDITNQVINSTSVVDTINDGQTALGSVSANEPVTWSIAAGTGVSIATDGTLTLDAVTSHSFTVKAEDESGNVSTKDLVVNVNATIAETCSTSPVTITVSSEFVDGASTYKYTTSDTNGNGGLYGCITASRGSTLTIYAVGEYVELVSHPIKITGYNDQGQQMGQLTGVVRTETGGQNNTGTYTLTWVVPADEGVDKYQYQCENHAHMRGTINVTGSAPAPAPATSVGDLNGDGIVDVSDLVYMQKHLNRVAGFELSGTDFDTETEYYTISGEGVLTSTKVQQEIGDGTGVVNVVISGFTSLGNQAFNSSRNISGSVTIPSTITSIGYYAFSMCQNVTSVIFESGSALETIGSSAFREIGASSITFPASVKSIGGSAFINCSNLSTVQFESESNLSSIGAFAFYGNSALSNIAIPEKLTTIGDNAFRMCASLTSVTLGVGSLLTSIEDSTFIESGLTTFSAPQGVLDNLGLTVGTQNVGGATNVSVLLVE